MNQLWIQNEGCLYRCLPLDDSHNLLHHTINDQYYIEIGGKHCYEITKTHALELIEKTLRQEVQFA